MFLEKDEILTTEISTISKMFSTVSDKKKKKNHLYHP